MKKHYWSCLFGILILRGRGGLSCLQGQEGRVTMKHREAERNKAIRRNLRKEISPAKGGEESQSRGDGLDGLNAP